MYQSMSNYDQSSDFYQRQPCFMPNNSNIANLAPPLNQRFQDSHYRFNQPQMLTFYPNLNRSPGVYHHMPGIPPNRQYDEYSSGSCHYRLVNMREGYNAPKLPPRTKNIVKITNPETGDNIFNELEKERKLNIPTENRSENIPKVENGGSSQSSPNTLSSTNLVNQLPNGIPNSASEESASPKTFMNHGLPPGSCESNSLMTSSSASSRPPSVSLASSSQEMASSSTAPSSSFFAAQQASGQSKSQHFNFANGRNGPVDVPFNERPSFHDQGKSVYCNHLPMMIPTFGCRPPYVPPHLQQIPGPRFSGFYNLPHNFYDQPNYYYEGEAMHSFYPHGNPHGFHQNLSRFPPLGHPAASLTQNSQSGSGSNSSEELNSECDLQFLSARLLDKALQNKGNKYSRHVSESRDEDKFKLDEDTPNEHNNTTDMQDVPLSASEKPALESGKSSEHDSNSCETSRDAKEITLDPNAKSFVYSGTLLESLKHIAGSSEVSIPGTSFDGNELDSPLLIG